MNSTRLDLGLNSHAATPSFSNVFRASAKPLSSSTRTPPANTKGTIRLLVVDDHPLVRQGLAFCLARHPRLAIVGEAADGQEGVLRALELAPDVVLMDLDMPRMDGLTATEILRQESPEIRILIFSMHRHPDLVLKVARAGASGYVLKEADPEQLLRAIEIVHQGGVFFSPELTHLALEQFVRTGGNGRYSGGLSERERQVLIAVAEGLTNKEIAQRLNVGIRTVESHREGLMRKLNLRGTAALTKYAVAQGLIGLRHESRADFAAVLSSGG